ncbi:MAG TPA: hypothetical protein VMV86_00575 [Methanosarcinales archaeon]|nr:hypothetical protein [Methanosarcinales archaeon]
MSIFTHDPIDWAPDTVCDAARFTQDIHEKMDEIDANILLKSKVIIETRNMAADSGDVSYTGIGFQPTSIQVVVSITGTLTLCVGLVDSSKTGACVSQYAANTLNPVANFVAIYVDGSNKQTAIIKSFDANGFTLTWTKTASPTGTATLIFLCFR